MELLMDDIDIIEETARKWVELGGDADGFSGLSDKITAEIQNQIDYNEAMRNCSNGDDE